MDTANLVGRAGLAIGTNRMEPQVEMGLHRHDNVELVIVTGGAGRHRMVGGAWELRRGDVFAVPVGMQHGYQRCRDLRLVNIGYDPARLDLPLARLSMLPGYRALAVVEPRLRRAQGFAGHLHLDEDNLVRVLGFFTALESELRERHPGWEASAAAWLLQILIHLARGYAGLDHHRARQAMRVAAVTAHIDGHFRERLTLAGLARIAGCSVPALTRTFRAAHGTSPMDRVYALRLDLAREHLARGDSVAAAARAAGIDDASYFARLFRHRTGLSPRAWRRGGSA
jgi:AraC-like DNA-binding protein